MTHTTKKVTPTDDGISQVKDLADATGGGLVQLTGELRIQTTGRQVVVYEGSWIAVRSQAGESWLFVWNESYGNQPPNMMLRL